MADFPTTIGSNCVVGHMTHLEGCVVKDWVLIGSGAIVLNRVTVQTRSIVGAGALIREGDTVPSGHLATGVPATMRELGKDHSAWMSHAVNSYVENGRRFREGLELVSEKA
jgi:carbonic anhydrase/acetyltransferase-like protein (isoleucine patch superfamily)